MNSYLKYVADLILEKSRGRKLALRYKNSNFEKALFEQTGLKAGIYVTRNPDRVDEMTFLDDYLEGKSNEYYLVILPEQPFNDWDNNRYIKMGYHPEKDFLWTAHKPIELGKAGNYTDYFGNNVECLSDVKMSITGGNNKIYIGKNVKMAPNFSLKIGNNTSIYIGDNVVFKPLSYRMMDDVSLKIGCGTKIEGMVIFINNESILNIGENNTIATGRIHTGRNQTITIGDDCMFSWNVVILGADGHLIWDLNEKKALNNTIEHTDSINIENHVWLGGECAILPHTHVGKGCILAYRSMIKGEFEPNSLIVGMPARVLKTDVSWTRENVTYNDEEDFKYFEKIGLV